MKTLGSGYRGTFVGTIAVAPDLEAISALSPGPFGGQHGRA